jgi:four helix bundle protein
LKLKVMRPHRKLVVWQEAIQFVVDIYVLTQTLPKDERFGLISQMRRASVSIAANIAEGAARNSDKENIRFLFIAEGSSSEMDTLLEICSRLKLISLEECQWANNKLEKISALMGGLRNSIERRINKGKN